MKNKGLIIALIIFLFLIVVGLITFLIIALAGKKINFMSFTFTNQSKNLILDKTYDNKYDKISIDANASDIEFKQSDDEKIYIKVYSEVEQTEIEENDKKLSIKSENKKCRFICLNQKTNKIEIYLPSTYEKNITIENKFGDIDISSFKDASLDINLNYGDIKIESVKQANIKTDCGDIEITGRVEELDAKVSKGDLKADEIDNLKVTSSLGDVKVSKVNKYLDIDSKCGDVKISKVNLEKNSNIDSRLGDVKIGSTNEIYIDAKTKLGDEKINNNYNKSDVTLKIRNSCGDIKIEN